MQCPLSEDTLDYVLKNEKLLRSGEKIEEFVKPVICRVRSIHGLGTLDLPCPLDPSPGGPEIGRVHLP
ncbi:MAG TPA: hypothetical protein VM942_11420 [Acidimicrobiales bacterium]|nr:hypothetical protein [Acidimicrobiales bacterium]